MDVVHVKTRHGLAALAAVLLMLTSGIVPLVAALGPRGSTPNTDSEPNDTKADATLVNIAGKIPGTLLGTDHFDNYKFQAGKAGSNAVKTYVEVDFDKANPLVSVYLRDSNGFLLDFARDNQVVKLYTIATSTSVTDYLNITDDSLGGQTYNVTISFSVVVFAGDTNNDPADAVAVGSFPYAVSDTLQGGTEPMDVQDFYKVSLSRTVSKADLLVTQLKQNQTAQFWLEVFDSSFRPAVGYEKQGEPKPGSTQTMTYGAQAAGIYYVRVSAANGTGPYNLSMDRIEIDLNDNNDKSADATPIQLLNNHTASFTGNVAEGIDLNDFWSLTVVKGQFINATITSLNFNASTMLPKMHLALLRSNGMDMYDIDPNMTHDQLDPVGFTNGTAADTGPVKNYIKVFVDNVAAGGGVYNVDLLTDRPPVANASLVVPITINESTVDKPSSDSSIKLRPLFADPDGNDKVTYSYSIVSDQGMADPANFTVAIAKDTDMTVTLTPRAGTVGQSGYRGAGEVVLVATDPYGLNATATFPITVTGTNHAPYVKSPYNATYSFRDPLTILYSESGLIETDLTKVFGDIDMNDKLTYEVNGSSPSVEEKTYGYTAVDQRHFLKSATINGTFILSFNLKANQVDQTGVVSVRLNIDGAKVKQAKEDRTPLEELVWFKVFDNGIPVKWSDQPVKLLLKAMSPNGTPPKWSQSFTSIGFDEDKNITMDFDAVTSDIDTEDAHARTYTVTGTGSNLTVQKLDRNHFKISAKKDWNGAVKNVLLNCTDTFGLYKTHTVDIVVGPVPDPTTIVSTAPSNATPVGMNEGGSKEFGLTVQDVDTDILTGLEFNWSLDGLWLRTVVGPNFTYQPSFDEAGTHAIKVVVSDRQYPALKVSTNWTVIVTNVNREPTGLNIVSPTQNQAFQEGTIVPLMAAAATDPDKEDKVTYSWKLDGTIVASTQTYDLKAPKKGPHVITLEVSDGKTKVTRAVNITVKAKTVSQPFNTTYLAVGLVLLVVIAIAIGLALRGKKAKPAEDEVDMYAKDRAAKRTAAKAAKKKSDEKAPPTDKGTAEETAGDEGKKGSEEDI